MGIACIALVVSASKVALAQTGPEALIRVHAYEGSVRPASQIATVFGPFAFGGELTLICKVNGKSYVRMGWTSNCPSVVYLLPGSHQLTITYRFANLSGDATIPVKVAAGRIYMVRGVRVADRRAEISTRAMPPEFVLTFGDLVHGHPKGKTGKRVNPADGTK